MKRQNRKKRSRKGMAMLMVLFIVMAIAVISSGFIARSDSTLACSRNFNVRNETDYVAWSGLEIAWAWVQSTSDASCLRESVNWETMPNVYYDLTLSSTGDPEVFTVSCTAYKEVGGKRQAESRLYGTLFYDSSDPENSLYTSITRQ